MTTVAIIPARGGSKRIPGKNIRPFAGLPMIAHSIRAAAAAQVFDRILVSTDSDEIAAIARQYGAEVLFRRPPELATDEAGTDAVLLHALRWLADSGRPADFFCCIYATAPFLQPEYLRQGLALLRGLAGINVIGADVVEVAPQYDPTSNTAQLGAQILFEEFALMTLGRKK